MLPEAGGEQLNTSGAHGTRPMISHSTAYSVLDRTPPCDLGHHRFHRSWLRARVFISSTSLSGCQRAPARVLAASSSCHRCSLGTTCSSMKADRRARSASAFSDNAICITSPHRAGGDFGPEFRHRARQRSLCQRVLAGGGAVERALLGGPPDCR